MAIAVSSRELDQTKQGVAALFLCVVQTLEEGDPSFRGKLLPRLRTWHQMLETRGDLHGAALVGIVSRALQEPQASLPT